MIKDKRQTYSKWYQKHVTEVLVQFKEEDPAWIPLDTYEAMPGVAVTNEESAYWRGELEGEAFEQALHKYGYEYTHIPHRY